MSTLVIPDTNVLLHFRMFDDLPWSDVVGADDLVLVIMWPIVRELDKLKSDPRVRDRARAILSRIEGLFADGDTAALRNGLRTQFDHCKNLRQTLLAHALDAAIGDDLVLAGILSLRSEDNDIVLVTDDAGMRLRARAYEIAVRRMPQDLRITSTDPLAAENAKLKREVDELRSALPKLELRYLEDGDVLQVVRSGPPPKGRRRASDILALQPLALDNLPFDYQIKLEKPTQAEVDEYNKQIEKLRPAFSEYLHQRDLYELFPHQSIALQFILRNIGGRPAEEIKLSFKFPSLVTIVSQEDVPKEPKKPEVPELPGRPRGIYALQQQAALFANLAKANSLFEAIYPHREDLEGLQLLSPSDPRGPDISTNNDGSINVAFRIPLLSNFDEVPLPLFYVKFGSPVEVTSFGFSYSIRSHSLPRLVEGKMNIRVTRSDTGDERGAAG